jgi:hypothetical protein
MTRGQSVTWELLLVLGLALLLVTVWGRFLGGLVDELATYHDVKLFQGKTGGGDKQQPPVTIGPGGVPRLGPFDIGPFHIPQFPLQPEPIQSGEHQFTIPLLGGGSMTVNANDIQSAIQNVIAQGGTPNTNP